MAFDKPSYQGGSFRQNVKHHEALRPKAGGTYTKPYFVEAFKPTLEPGEIDKIRIIPGSYTVPVGMPDLTIVDETFQYFTYIEHFHGTMKKGCICSGGPLHFTKDRREPCHACDRFWADKGTLPKGQKGPWSKRAMNAFTVLHYANYALVDQVDRESGKARTNTEGKAYTEWVHVKRHERLLPQFQGKEMREANLLHWSLGGDHWQSLTEYDLIVGRSCKSCSSTNSVESVAWTCRKCGEALIEPATSTLTPKEMEDFTTKEVRCGSCQHVGMLKEYVQCSGCNQGERAEIFDVDLDLHRLPDPKGGNRTQLQIVGCSAPRPIDARFLEFAKPMELQKVFVATPYEKQLEIFGGGSTRSPVTAADQSRAYSATRTLSPTK